MLKIAENKMADELKTHFIHEWVLCILISWSLMSLSDVASRLSLCVHFGH